jgi:hypothetical protein
MPLQDDTALRNSLAFFCILFSATGGSAEPACLGTRPQKTATDIQVTAPLSLQSGALHYRLAGLHPFAGEDGEALAASLRERVTGVTPNIVILSQQDRYGRPLVHLVAGDKLVAEDLVREGLARANGEDGDPCAASIRVAERNAMVRGAGLWTNHVIEARDATRLSGVSGTWVAVTGLVRSVRQRGRITYINFGGPREGALTAVVFEKNRARLQQAGVETEALKGQKVLVSGPLTQRSGPQIVIDTADQIAVLKSLDGR